MHIIYKSIKTESVNRTLSTMTKQKCSQNSPFPQEYGALFALVNNLLSLLSLLLRAALKTLSHVSSQYEIMVGVPASLSA